MHRFINVLFLDFDNSARSILAESLLRDKAGGRFQVFSAGLHPAGQINPYALELMQTLSLPTDGIHSKGLDEIDPAHGLDMIITFDDIETSLTHPPNLPYPPTAQWHTLNPAHNPECQICANLQACLEEVQLKCMKAFRFALRELNQRILLLSNLPDRGLDKLKSGQ
ncbi:MAG: hypothetical protein PHE55_06445 [Methylococcaceae bacterium]|nr:hypothetical protein [Methylococcaceae bacterium]